MGETDLISRQAVINALDSFILDEVTDVYGDTVREILERLPSAQPEPSQVARDIATIIENEQDMRVIERNAQQWIPCSERLPEESGEYLCMLVGVHNTGMPSECGYEPPNNHGITSGWSTCEADGFKFLRDDEVIAWMPLPEPWKGEDDERA